jgi:hypothetical protein
LIKSRVLLRIFNLADFHKLSDCRTLPVFAYFCLSRAVIRPTRKHLHKLINLPNLVSQTSLTIVPGPTLQIWIACLICSPCSRTSSRSPIIYLPTNIRKVNRSSMPCGWHLRLTPHHSCIQSSRIIVSSYCCLRHRY